MDLGVNKVKNKRKSLKKSKQIYHTSSVLHKQEVSQCLKDHQTTYSIVPIDKTSKKPSSL